MNRFFLLFLILFSNCFSAVDQALVKTMLKCTAGVYLRQELNKIQLKSGAHPYSRHRHKSDDEYKDFKLEALVGSAIIINKEGHLLTNAHVIQSKLIEEHFIGLNDGRTYPIKILYEDRTRDLALIEVDSADFQGFTTEEVAVLGDSSNVRVGEDAYVVGSPGGYFNTIMPGIISGLHRQIDAGPYTLYENMIQMSAPINGGNSGGSIFNAKGEVLGINSVRNPRLQAIGLAIPINIAKRQIYEFGAMKKINSPVLGLEVRDMSMELFHEIKLKEFYGVRVMDKLRATPGDDLPLRKGDVILEINGQKVYDTTHARGLLQEVAIDAEVELKYYSRGEIQTCKTMIGNIFFNRGVVELQRPIYIHKKPFI